MLPEANLFEAAQEVKVPRGGRTIASNGYVLIRVGTNHPLADVRGYAYEHRLIGSKKIGRWVKPQEHVHHVNGNKQDNRPENLEVCASLAEHFVRHRKTGCTLQLPGEANPQIRCACGCGESFPKFDDAGRPRRFVSGHNESPAPREMGVLATLANGPRRVRDIRAEVGGSKFAVATCLSKLKKKGLLENKGDGIWQLRQ